MDDDERQMLLGQLRSASLWALTIANHAQDFKTEQFASEVIKAWEGQPNIFGLATVFDTTGQTKH